MSKPPYEERRNGLRGVVSIVKLDFIVDVSQDKIALNRSEVNRVCQSAGLGKQPLFPLPHIVLNTNGLLRNKQIVLQRLQTAVMRELVAPIIGFSRRG
jgi:hypothetical protein